MTNSHLTSKEFLTIKAYYQEDITVSDITNSLEISKQTTYTITNDRKEGLKRKQSGHSEKRGKQAFRRDLRKRADIYPSFKIEFTHLERYTIVSIKHKNTIITLIERLLKVIITLKNNKRKENDIETSIN